MNKEEINELLHHYWYKGYITVRQHCDIYYNEFNEYPYNCTFKMEWLDEYYSWLAEKNEVTATLIKKE